MAKMLNVNFDGNRKLMNTEKVRFMIWNLPAVITCPFRTEACEKFCYARKAERVYPGCKPSRELNLTESRSADFVENMIFTISKKIAGKAYKGKKVIFRIHESGDFYSKEYLRKWLAIAAHFEKLGVDIVFMAYTKSVRFLVGEKIPSNMVVRFSLWADTKPEELAIATALDLPIYTADTEENVTAAVKAGLAEKCDCADCANCGKCWDRYIKVIQCVIH